LSVLASSSDSGSVAFFLVHPVWLFLWRSLQRRSAAIVIPSNGGLLVNLIGNTLMTLRVPATNSGKDEDEGSRVEPGKGPLFQSSRRSPSLKSVWRRQGRSLGRVSLWRTFQKWSSGFQKQQTAMGTFFVGLIIAQFLPQEWRDLKHVQQVNGVSDERHVRELSNRKEA
jgi:hypothetical protein